MATQITFPEDNREFSIVEYNEWHRKEQEAELAAIAVIAHVSFKDCLKGTLDTIIVRDHKGKENKITGSQIHGAWKSFQEDQKADMSKCRLVGIVDRLAAKFATWLRTQYTPRYRLITSPDDIAWLEKICQMVVTKQVMEWKWHNRQKGMFTNPDALNTMGIITLLREWQKETARGVNAQSKHADLDIRTKFLDGIKEAIDYALEHHRPTVTQLPPVIPNLEIEAPGGDSDDE
jgi:hypothetical protein